jgi:hypothetical protein
MILALMMEKWNIRVAAELDGTTTFIASSHIFTSNGGATYTAIVVGVSLENNYGLWPSMSTVRVPVQVLSGNSITSSNH